mgnify:FL=1
MADEKSDSEKSKNAFNFGNLTSRFVYGLARNLYTIKKIALAMAFVINLMLLFYKVSSYIPASDEISGEDVLGSGEQMSTSGGSDGGESGSSEDDDVIEFIKIEESWYYLEPLLKGLAMLHSLLSFFMLIAYYNLKVPLIIFKREKEIARNLEFEGLYITEQAEDNYRAYWDKLVISTSSFPVNYWDKFVKKRVLAKYAEQYDYDALSKLMGISKGSNMDEPQNSGLLSFITNCDWQYQIWKVGVTFMDNVSYCCTQRHCLIICHFVLFCFVQVFLYNLGYFILSLMGNFSYFFFAAHLLDIAVVIPTLKTILQSVTHNGKQLVLTVMLLIIVVYIYTVIAFNFFRKFYVQEEDDQVDRKCHNMLTVIIMMMIGQWLLDINGYLFCPFVVVFSVLCSIFIKVYVLVVALAMKLNHPMVMNTKCIVSYLTLLFSFLSSSYYWPFYRVCCLLQIVCH